MARHPGVRPCTSDGAGPEGALWARGPRTDRVARVPDGSRRGCTRRVDWWGLEEVLWTGEKVIYLLLLPSLAYRFFFFVGELKKKRSHIIQLFKNQKAPYYVYTYYQI